MKHWLSSRMRCPGCGGSLVIDLPQWRCAANCGVRSPEADLDYGFNQRWLEHPKPQATTAGVFRQKTGWQRGALHKRIVLDAGCGCGRFSRAAFDDGAHVVSVDVSPAGLAATAENAPSAARVQASLLRLPFADGIFDAAFSVGVLHHTADPAASFAEVARTVRVGGEFAVWLYCKPVTEDGLLPVLDMFHEITRACPPDTLHRIFEKYAVPVRDYYAGRWDALAQIVRVSNSSDDEECISDTFDWHTPQYRYWHMPNEVRVWFADAGFRVDWQGAFPVSMRGTKLR